MDYLARREIGVAVQVVTSGALFGFVHGIWGLFGRSVRAAAWPMAITGVLGAALAAVYVLGGRSLAPCIAAHFLLDVAIEPGLVLAALRGEMAARGRGREAQ
jgi:membrane protease YdiL (CAAX protease family)